MGKGRPHQSNEDFVSLLKAKGGKVKPLNPYVGYGVDLTFVCNKGHSFIEKPGKMLRRKPERWCIVCTPPISLKLKTKKQFVEQLALAKPETKLVGKYIDDSTHTLFRCVTCRSRRIVTPNVALRNGCNQCAIKVRAKWQKDFNWIPEDVFLARAKTLNPKVEVTLHSPYKNKNDVVTVTFQECGHTYKRKNVDCLKISCYKCRGKFQYSKIALDWLRKEEKERRIKIQHAGNIGEYRIPGTRYKADGFNKRSATVFEFLGDYWHKERETYQKSLGRLRHLTYLGYNVVYTWGSDFAKGLPSKELRCQKPS